MSDRLADLSGQVVRCEASLIERCRSSSRLRASSDSGTGFRIAAGLSSCRRASEGRWPRVGYECSLDRACRRQRRKRAPSPYEDEDGSDMSNSGGAVASGAGGAFALFVAIAAA